MKGAVDLDHLCRYTGGDEALNAEVLKLFDDQVTDMVGRLNAVLDARDAKSWRQITHTLKGAARGIGAFKFADMAAAAEPIDLISDRMSAAAAIENLTTTSAEVRSFIRDYLARAS
ncbi:HPt (histidine-containing phosphotransfer) domain-containing protein [Rhizomicrobium palustre]|uniref:HPt (Histidine-containing phosphotransfer) domain-containing protein n=1 Tax=Rhizomicrobium palustre TaxID=189966 RepID=A0A846MX53_9PROT|nr:Hpt domain-containing protein [Rhizomicrobium palustre]NIK88138.1 HPt (histidine-containing phosphotransfer) domain-containing protein [Rhizomicrobium palustre]